MYNTDRIDTILHFSTNIICFVILNGYSFLVNEKLYILNSWVQEFIYNLSDMIKSPFYSFINRLMYRIPFTSQLGTNY